MFLRLPDLLSAEELTKIRESIAGTQLFDGAISGKASLKKNLQTGQGNPGLEALTQGIIQALMNRDDFKGYALPKVITLVFNRYEPGMFYRDHMDAALMGGLRRQPLRSDLSFTLFLSAPADYDGGELVMQTQLGELRVKEPPGSAFVYPSNMIHRVEAVSRGTRWAAVGWIQSMVRDQAQRDLLFELFNLRREVVAAAPDSPQQERIDHIQENLIRMWAEV